MEVHHGSHDLRPPAGGTAVTLGNFDGVHLGHRRILDRLLSWARRLGARATVYTFEPHPLRVIDPARAPALLTPSEERRRLLEEAGVELLVCEPFTPEFSRLPAPRFVREVLVERLGARAVVVGPDYAFGHRRQGDLRLLRELGRAYGFEVEAVPPLRVDDQVVSSTAIRRRLREGRLRDAERMLGRPYCLLGTVTRGRARGRELGFPTANLEVGEQLVPREGVYAVEALLEGERWPGVLNVGRRPTFGEDELVLEVHLLGFRGELYGRPLRVILREYLRPERAFRHPEELAAQIARDVERARRLLSPS